MIKDPFIGLQLANFKVIRMLGQGGMASVYYGEDIKLHRPVAIKVLDKRYKNHPAYAGRFVNESRMMAKWRHENIIQIYYADETQGFPYYVMEYVDGQDLGVVMDQYHEEGKLMPIADALHIGKAVAGALDYAHRQGIIHRDVKPSNILLSQDGRVLLGDFGMALEVRDGSQGNIFGTPHYISPEQAKRSADAVPQSDIYSLGVIMYEILTGSIPFNDPSPINIALQHISQKPPSPRSINPNLSAEVETVLLKVLEKDSKERYQYARKFMEALEDALTSGGAPKKAALPPLPVGVPTIQRSDYSIEQIAKRSAEETPQKPPKKIKAETPPPARPNKTSRKRNYWMYLFLLLLIGAGGFYFFRDRLNLPALLPSQSSATTEAPAQISPEPALPTETELPSPTLPSQTPTEEFPTSTATAILVQPTETPTPTATPSVTPSLPSIPPTLNVGVEPTVKYPNGANFTLFYNSASFFMINRSFNNRSLSGFSFQRLDNDGIPVKDFFQGYEWESPKSKFLPNDTCVSISIYSELTLPGACTYGLLKAITLPTDKPDIRLFWAPKEDSSQFRVLWVGEEVARCEIAAGTCELFIP